MREWDLDETFYEVGGGLVLSPAAVAHAILYDGGAEAKRRGYRCRIVEDDSHYCRTIHIDQTPIDEDGRVDSGRLMFNFSMCFLASETWARYAAARAFHELAKSGTPMDWKVDGRSWFESTMDKFMMGERSRATALGYNHHLGGFDGDDLGDENDALDDDETKEIEPVCECEKPWNFGHAAECPWKKWKDAKK
jgi:hypothetical protein